jgi:hypothetical protein
MKTLDDTVEILHTNVMDARLKTIHFYKKKI